jgi:hypothetical protein
MFFRDESRRYEPVFGCSGGWIFGRATCGWEFCPTRVSGHDGKGNGESLGIRMGATLAGRA